VGKDHAPLVGLELRFKRKSLFWDDGTPQRKSLGLSGN